MRTRLVAGGLLAVTVALLVWLGGDLGLPAVALLGVAIGACLATTAEMSLAHRLAGFLAGVLIAWIGYGVRAAVLPDTDAGRAVAAIVVIGLCTAVTLAPTPFWAPLLGVAVVVGAYEETYTASPPSFLKESLTAVTSVLVAVAFGILATTLADLIAARHRTRRGQSDSSTGHEPNGHDQTARQPVTDQEVRAL